MKANPNDPPEVILEAVFHSGMQGFNQRYPGWIAQPFGALLVRLSRDAEKTARKIQWLTYAIVGLTIFLVILTAVLVWLTWVLVSNEAHGKPAQEGKLASQQADQDAEYVRPVGLAKRS